MKRQMSLREALKASDLESFIAQEEARGVGPVLGSELHRALSLVIKQPRSEDRTSRSPSGGGSSER